METTNEHFELFVKHCEIWKGYWALGDWVIDYAHLENTEDDGTSPMAGVLAMCNERYARVVFNKNVPEALVNEREIMYSAFHEMGEMLIMDLYQLAQERYNVSEGRLEAAGHQIISRLTNTIFEDFYEEITNATGSDDSALAG